MPKFASLILVLGGLVLLGGNLRGAEDPGAPVPDGTRPTAAQLQLGREALSQAAEDPTSSFWKLEVNSSEIVNYYALDHQTANTTAFRFGGPFKWGDQLNIFRVSLPFITDDPKLQSGLSDVSVFDLLVYNQPWGRWGFGPVALFPTGGTTRGAGQYAIGPVIGVVFHQQNLLFGVLNQNLFTYAGDDHRPPVKSVGLQPILNYSLGNGWSVGSSDMSWTYNLKAGRWTNQPVGMRLSKVTRLYRRPVQLSLEYEWNLTRVNGDISQSLRFNFILFQRNPFAAPSN